MSGSDDRYDLTEEEVAMLEESMAQLERGEWFDWDEIREERRRRREQVTPEQLAELDAAIAEADRGESVPAEEVLREIRAMRERRS